MEIFKNKFLVKLIATICLFLTLFNFAGTTSVQAAKEDDEVWGGVLVNPIVKLLTALGDAIMELLHRSVQEQKAAIIKLSGNANWLEKVGAVVLSVVIGIVVAVVFVAAVVATAGAVAWAAAAITAGTAAATFTVSISAGTVLAGAAAGVCVGLWVNDALIPNDIYLPVFSITAEEIFSNELQLFDVNFFDPMDDLQVVEKRNRDSDRFENYNSCI